jgi:hypothetical protein
MRKTDVIEPMLDLNAKLKALPPPCARGYYTGAELSQVLGRIPRHTDANVLRLLGWVRVARVVKRKLARVWIPPTHARALFDSTPT